MRPLPGRPLPLGANYDGSGTNFSVFSSVADRVELCLFDPHDDAPLTEHRIEVTEVDAHVWHVYLPEIGPGQRYGYRVHGPWDPAAGLWCNPNKLLLDPYTKSVDGVIDWDEACFPYTFGDELARNDLDSAPHVSRSVVHNPYFEWGNDRPPDIALADTVLYEVHVKGFTQRHPDIPHQLRGTYAGLAHPSSIEYFRSLGVTAVELLPVHQFVHDAHLRERGLRNCWGYNSIAYFAPHNEYTSTDTTSYEVQEFKQMVRTLHEAGIEVILDVVYNHTAEGNHLGPVLSLKGLDNPAYYRLMDDDPRFYMDYTGTGNSMNMRHPHVLQLIMDSLRYWITEMHVDGFRFDLAATLARELHEVDRLSAFFDIVQQDPVVSQVKLIAEPWDVGPGGYQVGNFPVGWTEWNGKYRDCVRRFWRGDGGQVSEFATRLAGSSDLYEQSGRRPHASINFVTAHDGFTLRDLVSYEQKHNEANQEGNRDGDNHNNSWNCGAEGETDDAAINTLRQRQQRNLLATLLLSQGVPMICGGDEFGRTQGGNNNAYCHDNEISWLHWDHDDEQRDLLALCRFLIRLNLAHPVFHRRKFFQGQRIRGAEVQDLTWFEPSGEEMTDESWDAGTARCLMVRLSGYMDEVDEDGRRIVDDDFILLLNASPQSVVFHLPAHRPEIYWERLLDTGQRVWGAPQRVRDGRYRLADRSIAVFRVAGG